MVTNQPSDGIPSHGEFSAALISGITVALADSMSASGAGQDAALRALAHQVCDEARHLDLPPEKMLIAIKHLFERLPQTPIYSEQRRRVFDRFISSCIDDYYK